MNEKVIIEEIKKGNRNQLANIYRAYRSEFIAWLSSKFECSRDEARDIYQIAILTLHENIVNEKLKHLNSSIKTYLFAIGKNKILESKKAQNRFSYEIDPGELELEEINNWEQEDREQHLELMKSSVEKLGNPCKSLLELYYYHNMSLEAIAGQMSYKNTATAKTLKFKCLGRLRNIFKVEMKNWISNNNNFLAQ
jgi:RNA polymerase sigma-70 factor (ECF subfamily)